jgi:uncharacterized protein (TIGR00369 family)
VVDKTRWDVLVDGSVPFPVNATMGWELQPTDDPTQSVTFTWTVTKEYCNSAGNLQGGILAAFADAVLGAVTTPYFDADHYPALAQMNISFFRPAPAGMKLIATGRVVKKGRRIMFAEVEVTDSDGTLIAKATGTEIPAQA